MSIKTTRFDAAKYLTEPEDHVDILNDALKSGHAPYIAAALGVIARARGMSKVAQDANVTRVALYKALSKDGDPRLSTLLGVLSAVEFGLTAFPIGKGKRGRKPSGARAKKPARIAKAA
ncbi:MAG: addiction module antidote protein [Dehalococcoidia bacterium]